MGVSLGNSLSRGTGLQVGTGIGSSGLKLNGFLPTDQSGLKLWLHGVRSGVTPASGAKISQWNDLSGLSNHPTQVVGSVQPRTGTDTLNGKNIITFALSAFMNLPFLGIDSTDYEMFFVFRTASALVQFLIGGGTTENYEIHLNGAIGARFIPITGKFSDIGSTGDFSDNAGHLVGSRVESDVGIVRANGVDTVDTETPAQSANTQAMFLGQRVGDAFRFGGGFAEIAVYSPARTVSQRAQLETYFNNGWGL